MALLANTLVVLSSTTEDGEIEVRISVGVLPKLLAWLFKRKFHIEVQIGRIVIPYLSLKDVHIARNGFSVHIDEIGFRSSFFSSEVTKLLAVIVRDVRVNKDVGSGDVKNDKLPPELFDTVEIPHQINFHNKKIPPAIITFAQFMAVHVYNVNTMILRTARPECLVHATAAEVHLDGSIVHNARTLLVNITVNSITAKILRHADKKDDAAQTCLGELSFGISLEAAVLAQGPLSVDVLNIAVEHTNAVINEGFYIFVQERKQTQDGLHMPKNLPQYYKEDENILSRFTAIIPKNFCLKVEDSVLTGMRDSHTDFNSTLQCFKLNMWFSPSMRAQESTGRYKHH
uniref:(California timema) hypothetical protein n=1 Tax=Timema californicum TaxID=61474 RepID=A0A7R9IXQ0_TIMCA|nr:unnamed protein product [Timema californicum]